MKNKACIAVVVGPDFEDVEVTDPVAALEGAGYGVEYIGLEAGQVVHGKQGEASVRIDHAAADARADCYLGLLIPGGYSPDNLRTDRDMVRFVDRMTRSGRPVAAICHGPQLLIEADAVRNRRLTAVEAVRTDLRNAGALVEDEPVVEDGALITSRTPEDLPDFDGAFLRQLERAEARAMA